MIKLILNFFYFAFVRHLVKILDIIQDIRDQIPLYLQDELEFQVDNERLTFTAVDNRKAPVPAKNSQLSLFDEDER